jgi:hypothetical protein
MMVTNYSLPFVFEVPPRNPWEGQRTVDLTIETAAPLSAADIDLLQDNVFPFWLLASSGALSMEAGAPPPPAPEQPSFSGSAQSARFVFDGWRLDERASHCLLCLLLAAHADVPLKRVRLSSIGQAPRPITVDPKLKEPYPQAPPKLPFPWIIEDSENDVRELHITFAAPLSDEQWELVSGELTSAGIAIAAGAYGVAPVPPEDCGCLPSEDVEHYDNELRWVLEDCRFHPDALEGLIGVCVSLHHHIAAITSVTIS